MSWGSTLAQISEPSAIWSSLLFFATWLRGFIEEEEPDDEPEREENKEAKNDPDERSHAGLILSEILFRLGLLFQKSLDMPGQRDRPDSFSSLFKRSRIHRHAYSDLVRVLGVHNTK